MVDITEDEDLENLKKFVKTVMADGKNLPPEAVPHIEEALTKMITENATLTEALGLTPEMLEEIYQEGYLFFQSGKFKEALPIFHLLRRLNGLDARYTFAIAACLHQMKNYDEAVGNYIICEALERTNPYPYYHMYDCFKNMNQPELADNALKLAHRLAGSEKKFEEMKGKIELELARIKEKQGSSA